MKKYLLINAFLIFVSGEMNAQLSATTSFTNPTCTGNNGSATVAASGGSGYTYKWSNGAATAAINNLAAGTYSVTVYSSGGTQWDTVYLETFDGTANWTLNIATGTNDADNNYWVIGGGQNAGGATSGSCVSTSATDLSLHVTSVSQAFPGATYDAGSQGQCTVLPGLLFCTTTNMAAQSPDINTSGVQNLVMQYDFFGNGQGSTDNGSCFYSENGGASFISLDTSLKSSTCGAKKGVWTSRSYNLPVTCNNISNFKIRFNWTNDDDAVGSDPSVAVNNILLRDSIPLPGDSIVKTVTLTAPSLPHFVTSALSITNPSCGQNNGSINNMGVAGGTTPYTLVWKISGAQIGTGNSLTNIGGGTYTFEVTDQNGCVIDTSFTLVSTGNGNPVTITANDTLICASDSAQVCASAGFAQYHWNNGATTPCFITRLAGNYYVTVSDGGSCTATSNHLSLTVYALPPVSISVNGDTLSAFNAISYQWFLNNDTIPGATHSVYIAAQAGSYTVSVTDTNGCHSVSTAVTISGIADDEADKPIIYPNPFNEVLSFRFQVSSSVTPLEISDITERTIFTQQLITHNLRLNTSSWARGIYFVRCGTFAAKLVKSESALDR